MTSSYGTGSHRSVLSKSKETSAMPAGGRPGPPANSTSSVRRPRSTRRLCSPSTHRTASAMLLLPLPLGPTIAVMPRSKTRLVRPENDLKPARERDLRRTTGWRGATEDRWPPGEGLARGSLLGLLFSGALADPEHLIAHADFNDEVRPMAGPGGREEVVGRANAELALSKLLEIGFGVSRWLLLLQTLNLRRERPQDECTGRLKPLIEIDRPHDR